MSFHHCGIWQGIGGKAVTPLMHVEHARTLALGPYYCKEILVAVPRL